MKWRIARGDRVIRTVPHEHEFASIAHAGSVAIHLLSAFGVATCLALVFHVSTSTERSGDPHVCTSHPKHVTFQ